MNISKATAEDIIDLLEQFRDELALDAQYIPDGHGAAFPNDAMALLERVKFAINFLRFPDDPS